MNLRFWVVIAAAVLTAQSAMANTAEPIRGTKGMVVTRSEVASNVGADVIAAGGNAIDAAVAVGFALAVAYPSAGNLGGGGFMVIRLADGDVVANDHRERAPAGADRDMFLGDDGNVVEGLSTDTHLAAGVPGTVAGLLDVHERYGVLALDDVIDPAIALARDGFPLSADLARDFASRLPDFASHPAALAVFAKADGTPYREGDLFIQEDLAATLTRIRDGGRDGFYKGETADLLVAEMQRGGGRITQADLDTYRSVWRAPIVGTYRGYDIVSMPPPSSGGILLVQMLNMLERYNLRAMGPGSARAIHHMVEAARRAYADRAMHLGDADFYPVPVARLIDKAYAVVRFGDFDSRRASESADIGAGYWPERRRRNHPCVRHGRGRQRRGIYDDAELLLWLENRGPRRRFPPQQRDGRLRRARKCAERLRAAGRRSQFHRARQAHAEFHVAHDTALGRRAILRHGLAGRKHHHHDGAAGHRQRRGTTA